ncbi:MAG: hypothetical protein F4X41_00185 [Chloroflexi bacterium]|nr:hypothetical protein [Chloroflexota bacterium]
MAEEAMLNVGVQFVQAILPIAAKYGFGRIREVFRPDVGIAQQAVSVTVPEFAHIPGAEIALGTWISSDEFNQFIVRLEQGERDLGHAEIVASFTDVGGFHFDDQDLLEKTAAAVLSRFIGHLSNELLRSENGLLVHDAREEDRKNEILSALGDATTEIKSSLSALSAQSDKGNDSVSEDPALVALSGQVDLARDLFNQFQIRSARTALQQIQESETPLPPAIKFRICTYLAYCYLAEDEIDRACELIDDALGHSPNSEIALANAALAAEIREDPELAEKLARKAIKIDARNSRAFGVLLRAYWRQNQVDDLELLISSHEWMTKDVYCASILAEIRSLQQRHPEAIGIMREITESESVDPNVFLAQASIEIASVEHHFQSGKKFIDARPNLLSAVRAASCAIDSLNPGELDSTYHSALVIRGQAHAMLGSDQMALEDLDAVLSRDPTNRAARLIKGMLLIDDDRTLEAVSLLRPVVESKPDPTAKVALAEAELANGNPRAAIDLLGGEIDFCEPNWSDVRRAELLIRAEVADGLSETACKEIAYSIRRSSNNPRLFAMAALYKDARNDLDAAMRWSQRAAGHSTQLDTLQVGMLRGVLLRKRGRFGEAADEIAVVVDGDAQHLLATDLLICLVNSKRFKCALDWARAIRANAAEPTRLVLEVEAKLYELVGDMPLAIERRSEICALPDSTAEDEIDLAIALIRDGNKCGCVDHLNRIDRWSLSGNPNALMRVAHLKRHLQIQGYLDDAYLARRMGLHDANVHMGYFALIGSDDGEISEETEVTVGSAVRLRVGQIEQWWQIFEDERFANGSRDIGPDSEMAQLLIGKKVGDEIEIERGFETLKYEVIEIQSKFVRAFQETTAEFSTRFPTNLGINAIEIAGDDFSNFFRVVNEHSRYAEEVGRVYEDGMLPFTIFCARLGRSIAEVWRAFSKDDSHQIQFATGSEEEAETAANSLANADAVVVDALALIAIHELGIADDLRNRFARVLVPQHVVDEFVRSAAEASLKAPAGHVGVAQDGRYFLTEVDRSYWDEWREFVNSLAEFSGSLGKTPCYPLLAENDAEECFSVLRAPGVGVVFSGCEIGHSEKTVIVCDDLILGRLAVARGRSVANTQSLLEELNRTQILSDDRYSAAIESLATFGYKHIRVGVSDVVYSYRENGFASNSGTRALLGALSFNECPAAIAASIGAGIILELVSEVPPRQLQLFLMSVVTELRKRPDAEEATERFKAAIVSGMPFNRGVADHLNNTVDLLVHFGNSFIVRN